MPLALELTPASVRNAPVLESDLKRSKPELPLSHNGCKTFLEKQRKVPASKRPAQLKPTVLTVLFRGDGMRPKSMPKNCVKNCGHYGYMREPRCNLCCL